MADLTKRGVAFENYDLPGLKTESGLGRIGRYNRAWFRDSEGDVLAPGQIP